MFLSWFYFKLGGLNLIGKTPVKAGFTFYFFMPKILTKILKKFSCFFVKDIYLYLHLYFTKISHLTKNVDVKKLNKKFNL